jgi:hypothetical protein
LAKYTGHGVVHSSPGNSISASVEDAANGFGHIEMFPLLLG